MRKSIFQLASIAFVGGIVGRGLRYAINVVIARGLGSEALGLFALGVVLMKVPSVVARVGLDTAAQKFVPIYLTEEDEASLLGAVITFLALPFIVGTGLAGAIYAGRDVLLPFFGGRTDDAVLIFLLGIPVFSTMMVGVSVTKGFKETKYAVFVREFGQSGLAILFVALAAFVFSDFQLVVWGYVLSIVFALVLLLYFLYELGGVQYEKPRFRVREILAFSLPLTVMASAQYLLSSTDVLILSYFSTETKVGWYQAAYQTSALLPIFLQASNSIFPAIASDLHHTDNQHKLKNIYSTITKWITYLTLFAAVFLIIHSNAILHIFRIGAEQAIIALVVLTVGQSITAMTGPVGFLLVLSGYERLDSMNNVLISVCNVVLNVVLVREFGVVGAAVATTLSLSLLNVLRLGEVRHLLGFQPYNRNYSKGILTVGAASVVMLVTNSLVLSPVVRLVLSGLLSFGFFLSVLYLAGLDEKDRLLIESIDE